MGMLPELHLLLHRVSEQLRVVCLNNKVDLTVAL